MLQIAETFRPTHEPCGSKKRTVSIHPKALSSLSVDELRLLVSSEAFPKETIKRMTRAELCKAIQDQSIRPHKDLQLLMRLPTYSNNSCYLDSTFVALFHRKDCMWIRRVLKKDDESGSDDSTFSKVSTRARHIVQKLWSTLHSSQSSKQYTCSIVRKAFKTYDKHYQKHFPGRRADTIEWLQTQQEPLDVLNAFLRLFRVRDNVVIERQITGGEIDEVRVPFTYVIINDLLLDEYSRQSSKKLHLAEWLPVRVESIQQDGMVKKTERILKAPMLVISITRNLHNRRKITNAVVPLDVINDINKGYLECVSIIIHHGGSTEGGHYTVLLKYYKNALWYHYDDMEMFVELVGHWPDVLVWRNGMALRNGTQFVYIHMKVGPETSVTRNTSPAGRA